MLKTEDGMTHNEALTFPLATALLQARHRQDVRSRGKSPANPETQAILNARAAVRRYYETHFQIVTE